MGELWGEVSEGWGEVSEGDDWVMLSINTTYFDVYCFISIF